VDVFQSEAVVIRTMLEGGDSLKKVKTLIRNPKEVFTSPEVLRIADEILKADSEGFKIEEEAILTRGNVDEKIFKNIVDSYRPMSIGNIKRILPSLKENSINFDLKKGMLAEFTNISSDDTISVSKKIDMLMESFSKLRDRGKVEDHTFKDMQTLSEEHRKILESRKETPDHYSCGDIRLDAAMTYGFAPGNSTVIAGRPSNGKSAYALELARLISGRGVPTAIFNMEMENKGTMDRLLSSVTQISPEKLIRAFGTLTEREISGLQEKLGIEHIDVFWDLFTHLKDFRGATSAMQYEDVSKRFQAMYKRLGIHGVMILQINRKAVEDRVSKLKDIPKIYPMTSHIKNSDSFLETADNALLVCRPKIHVIGTDFEDGFPEYMRVELAKQRGPGVKDGKSVFLYKTQADSMGFVTPPETWNPLEFVTDEG